ncbi:hypothetical protein CBR_g4065 [Chara braunii]|uniref:RWP-RK domain-containing protein n=1 Tax=Chara braunii TaxID=69332 RepID=A0A388KH52_CHABU|nr:hypothetical protein CBR_g4065 [Chara braunii]|eukprot:GBG69372.1 hypothetical protein CBR_g4065 [Chara braunii]
MPKPRGLAHRSRSLTLQELSEHFHLPINDVARKLGLCVTVLKQRCREHGITRWPYRKVRKLDNMICALETNSSGCGGGNSDSEEEKRKQLETVKETRSYLLANPNSSAHLRLGKVKYLCKKSAGVKEDGQHRDQLNQGEEINDVVSDKTTGGCSYKLLPSYCHPGKPDGPEKTAKRARTSVGSSVTDVSAASAQRAGFLSGADEEVPPSATFMPAAMSMVMSSECPVRERDIHSGCVERVMQGTISGAKDRSESSGCSLNGPMTELALSQGSGVDDETDIHLGMSPTAKVRTRFHHTTTTTTGSSLSPVSPSSEGSKEAARLEMTGACLRPACNSSNGFNHHPQNKCVAPAIGIGSISTPNVRCGGAYAGPVAGPGFISSGRLSAFRPLGKTTALMYSNSSQNGDGQSPVKVSLASDRGVVNDMDKVSGVMCSNQQRQACSGNSVSTSLGTCVVGDSVKLTLATGVRGDSSSPPPSPKQGSLGQSGCTSGSDQPEHDAKPLLCKIDTKASGSLCSEANSEERDMVQEGFCCLPVISLSLKSISDDVHPRCGDPVKHREPIEQVKKGTSQGNRNLFMLTSSTISEEQLEHCDHPSFCNRATCVIAEESHHEGSEDMLEKTDTVGTGEGAATCKVEDGELSLQADYCIKQPGSAKSVSSSPVSFAVAHWPCAVLADEEHDESALQRVEIVPLSSNAGMSSRIQPVIIDANTCLTMSTCSATAARDTSPNSDKHSHPPAPRPLAPSPTAPPLPCDISQSSGPLSAMSLATQHWLSPLLFPSSGPSGGTSAAAVQLSSSLLNPLVLGMAPSVAPIGSVLCTNNMGGGTNPFGWAGVSRMMPWALGLHEMIGGMAGLVAATSSIRRAAIEAGGWGSTAAGESCSAWKASDDSGNHSVSSSSVDCNSSLSMAGLAVKRF